MVLSSGAPNPLAAFRSTSPPAQHGRPQRARGAGAVLDFFFLRVLRSGPRLLLYLALLLAASLLATICLPTGLSDSIASSTSHLWRLRPSSLGGSGGRGHKAAPGENNGHDGLAGGGLRIVVFGENDIATSMLQNVPVDSDADLGANNQSSWTRELCVELGCTTYLSNVPDLDLPRRSLSSNPLYAATADNVLRESKGKTPANDYAYLKDAYPISWEAPDLYGQVAMFLDRPAPQRPPKETIWVFSVGMWDVWSLAAFPYSHAEGVVTAMVADLFANIEAVYDAAHDAASIAYSNRSMTPLGEASIRASANQTAGRLAARGRAPSKLPWDNPQADPFRVVVPLLSDPSLVPGWHLDRPAAPKLHAKPEQLRNAARLTKLWNDYVIHELGRWSGKGTEFVHPDDRKALEAAKAAKAAKAAEAEANAEGAGGGASRHRRRDGGGGRPAPSLERDGILFRLPDYVMDVTIDGQLRASGLSDRRGFGKFSSSEAFADVDRPCLAPPPAATGTPRADAADGAATALQVCEHPDRHLFFTPFSLGQRAIGEVGRLSAALLRANRTARAAWEQARQSAFERDRPPSAWKGYYSLPT